jgi:hypothetical protein
MANSRCLYCDEELVNKHLYYCPLNDSCEEHHGIYNDNTIKDVKFSDYFLDRIKSIELPKGTYTQVNGGLGSNMFIRSDLKGNRHYLFMNQYDWGQYGKESSRVPALKSFIYGFNAV